MRTAPNSTTVTGRLVKAEAAADGFGGDLEIEVTANESADPEADFIKPPVGQILQAFYGDFKAKDAKLVGHSVRASLTQLGGPSGTRPVVQSLEKAD